MEKGRKLIANNKKARHDYFILETYECGIELFGTEVKSMRLGQCSLKEAYVRIKDGEIFVFGMHVSPYEKGNIFNKDPLRVRRLLMHKKEIAKLSGKVKEQGCTLVPLEAYFDHGLVKIEIALAKGKKLYDKREAIAKQDARRDVERTFAERQK
ncbi:MAG: SsrA-binding protein SmpB [Lachnospiraceae bacterium]|nr:SsrA-binding protein SmpB [Lachnospiraceae bacterium]